TRDIVGRSTQEDCDDLYPCDDPAGATDRRAASGPRQDVDRRGAGAGGGPPRSAGPTGLSGALPRAATRYDGAWWGIAVGSAERRHGGGRRRDGLLLDPGRPRHGH